MAQETIGNNEGVQICLVPSLKEMFAANSLPHRIVDEADIEAPRRLRIGIDNVLPGKRPFDKNLRILYHGRQ